MKGGLLLCSLPVMVAAAIACGGGVVVETRKEDEPVAEAPVPIFATSPRPDEPPPKPFECPDAATCE